MEVFCIMGPTASGKSAFAMEWAQANHAEIVSVDSTCVYRGMDIGTAKPSREDQQLVLHHLLDVADPGIPYSAADFCRDALVAIESIISRGKQPLLVGGTMLYFHMLQHGFADLPKASSAVRQALEEEATQRGWGAMHARLHAVDPVAAARIEPTDPQRIQRALEVYEMTGKPLTQLQKEQAKAKPDYVFRNHIIAPADRGILHQRIAERFDAMVAAGFEQEVRALYARGDLTPVLPAVRAVGYRQMWQYFEGELDYTAMRERAIIATRQLAKRQYTWLKKFD